MASGEGEKDYSSVMEAWRTSCPGLPVFEEALDRGLIARTHTAGRSGIAVTQLGRAYLAHRTG